MKSYEISLDSQPHWNIFEYRYLAHHLDNPSTFGNKKYTTILKTAPSNINDELQYRHQLISQEKVNLTWPLTEINQRTYMPTVWNMCFSRLHTPANIYQYAYFSAICKPHPLIKHSTSHKTEMSSSLNAGVLYLHSGQDYFSMSKCCL